MTSWETIKDAWPLLTLLGGHVIRTEVSAAVSKAKHAHAKDGLARVENQLQVISEDIKDLLKRERQ